MSIVLEEMNVEIRSENKSWLSEEGDVNKIMFASNERGPDVEGVDDQGVDGGILGHQVPHQLIHMGWENMHDPLKELVVVEGSIKP